MKLLVVILGVICVALVFVVEKLGTVLEISISLGAITGGPVLGLFTMGMLFPFANTKVSFWAEQKCVLMSFYVILGRFNWKHFFHLNYELDHYKKKAVHLQWRHLRRDEALEHFRVQFSLELNLDGICNVFFSVRRTKIVYFLLYFRVSPMACPEEEVSWVYRTSFFYSTLMGVLITMFVGLLVSWISRTKNDEFVDPDLLCPFVRKLVEKSQKNIQYVSVEKALNFVDKNNLENESTELETVLKNNLRKSVKNKK